MIFATRGTDLSKIEKRVSEEWKAIISYKKAVYNITKKGQQLGRDDITLARLGACSPHLMVCLAEMKIAKSYVDFKVFEKVMGSIKPVMKTNMLTPIIPDEEQYSSTLKFMYMYTFMFDKVIEKNTKVPETPQASASKIQKYVDASIKSTYIDHESRVMFMRIFKISNENGPIKPLIKRQMDVFATIWDSLVFCATDAQANEAIKLQLNLFKESARLQAPERPIRQKSPAPNRPASPIKLINLDDYGVSLT